MDCLNKRKKEPMFQEAITNKFIECERSMKKKSKRKNNFRKR